jgi:hypothetical protein
MSFIKNIPPDVPCCDDIKQRAICFMEIQLFGKLYYVPITRKAKKILGITESKGEFLVKNRTDLEKVFRDIIAGTYLQIRDTVGSEIKSSLSDEIQVGLEKMFTNQLSIIVDKRLEEKMLPSSTGKENPT